MMKFKIGLILLMFISLWGCGKGNSNNVVFDTSGKHPANWAINHGSFCRALPGVVDDPAAAISSACSECHGSDLTGGTITTVSCMSSSIGGISCHAISPLTKPTGCIICHGKPPATGKHGKHFASIANLSCSTSCHFNLGSGTAKHADINTTVIVALSPTYQAKTGGTATLNPDDTCSFVSCHGGQTTPPWTAANNVNLGCNNCHGLGTTQYNSYNSGEHDFHINSVGLACIDCHNTANLAINHFTHLETQLMEGPASATVGGGTTGVASYVPASGSCTPSDPRPFPTGPCHATRVW